MSLAFAGGATDRVNHGQSSSIDDLPGGANGITLLAWVYRTANASDQHLFSMDGVDFTTRAGILVVASDDIRILVRRATADTDYVSNTGFVPLNAWTFVALTFQDSLSPEVDIYTGSLTAAAAEVTYATTTDGTDAITADNANDKWVGNLERANTLSFNGRVARLGYFNRRLTLAEIQRLQFAPAAQWAGSDCKLLVDYHGTGVQPDYSGNANAGTVTGATAADHVPLGPAWGFDDQVRQRQNRRFLMGAH